MSPTIPLSLSLCEDLLNSLSQQYLRLQASSLLKAMILNGYELPIATLENWKKSVQAGRTTEGFQTWANSLQVKINRLVESSLFRSTTHLATIEGLQIEGDYFTHSWLDLISKFDEIMSQPPGQDLNLVLVRTLKISKESDQLSTLEKKMIMATHAGFTMTRSNGGPHGSFFMARFDEPFDILNYDDSNHDHDSDSLVQYLYPQWEEQHAKAS